MAKNPAAVRLGRLGGSKNTAKQQAARRQNAPLGGRSRRVCTSCGSHVDYRKIDGVTHHGHLDPALDASCHGHRWTWQTPSEKRTRT